MGQQTKKAKKSTETLAKRVGKVELAIEKIESRLGQKESHVETRSQHAAKLEQRISNQMIDLQNQIREIGATGPNHEAMITLDEGCVLNLEELEKKIEEKYDLLAAREEKLQNLQKSISAELENLRAEIKERDLLLAAREVEIKSFKQTLGSRIEELENLVRKQPWGKNKATRLVSFLVDIGKKH